MTMNNNREDDINEYIKSVVSVLCQHKKVMQHNLLFSLNSPLQKIQEKLLEVHGISDTVGILARNGLIHQHHGLWCLSKIGSDLARSLHPNPPKVPKVAKKVPKIAKKVPKQPGSCKKDGHRQVRFAVPSGKSAHKRNINQLLKILRISILDELLTSNNTPLSLMGLRSRNQKIDCLVKELKEEKSRKPLERIRRQLVREGLILRSPDRMLVLTTKGIEVANQVTSFHPRRPFSSVVSIPPPTEQDALDHSPTSVETLDDAPLMHEDELIFHFQQSFHI